MTHGDIRQCINWVQLRAMQKKHLTAQDVQLSTSSSHKDFDQNNIFSLAPEFFVPLGRAADVVPPTMTSTALIDEIRREKSRWISDRINLFMNDSDLVPLMVQEAYPSSQMFSQPQPGCSERNQKLPTSALHLMQLADAADSISFGDLLAKQVWSDQDWSLGSNVAVMSAIAPGFLINGQSCSIAFTESVCLGTFSLLNL